MFGVADCINRIRHNRGFGIQSPSAFHFVTQVLKETYPYYGYTVIDGIADASGESRKKHLHRLFRIANYLQPDTIISTGTARGTALCALSAARRHAATFAINADDLAPEASKFLADGNCRLLTGEEPQTMQTLLQKDNRHALVHIGENDRCAADSAFAAIRHADSLVAIVIEGIRNNPDKLHLWEETTKSPATVVTYDLYDTGILFFDKEKPKQHYTLKMQ